VALCNDQYSRWGLEQLARSSFLFLEASRPLNLRSWPGYTPKRGQLDGSFPADRLMVYSFALHLPHAVSALAVRQKVLLHAQQQQQRQQQGVTSSLSDVQRQEQEQEQEQQQQQAGRQQRGGVVVRWGDDESSSDDGGEEGLGDIGFSVFSGVAVLAGRY